MTIAPDDDDVLLGVASFRRAPYRRLFGERVEEKQVVKEGAATALWFEHPAELVSDRNR